MGMLCVCAAIPFFLSPSLSLLSAGGEEIINASAPRGRIVLKGMRRDSFWGVRSFVRGVFHGLPERER